MITAERLREALSYDPETGVVIRLAPARAWQHPSKNASGFKGVRWHKAGKAWQGRIKIDGKERHLGLFDTSEDAAAAYQEAERKAFVAHRAGWFHRAGGSLGYMCVQLDGHEYRLHHVIWCMQTGHWPSGEIDHISGDGLDNRWCNLREATRVENAQNVRLRCNNRSGFKGVSWCSWHKKWHAQIQVSGKRIYLGFYDTPERAFIAYFCAAWKYHGDFAKIDADYLVLTRKWKARKAFEHGVLRNLANLSIYGGSA